MEIIKLKTLFLCFINLSIAYGQSSEFDEIESKRSDWERRGLKGKVKSYSVFSEDGKLFQEYRFDQHGREVYYRYPLGGFQGNSNSNYKWVEDYGTREQFYDSGKHQIITTEKGEKSKYLAPTPAKETRMDADSNTHVTYYDKDSALSAIAIYDKDSLLTSFYDYKDGVVASFKRRNYNTDNELIVETYWENSSSNPSNTLVLANVTVFEEEDGRKFVFGNENIHLVLDKGIYFEDEIPITGLSFLAPYKCDEDLDEFIYSYHLPLTFYEGYLYELSSGSDLFRIDFEGEELVPLSKPFKIFNQNSAQYYSDNEQFYGILRLEKILITEENADKTEFTYYTIGSDLCLEKTKTVTFKYDNAGNWISQEQQGEDGEKKRSFTRVLTYYK